MKTETTHLTCSKDPQTGGWIFSGRVTDHDITRLNLYRLDRAVITSPTETSADVLQSLDIIFRRLGKQNE